MSNMTPVIKRSPRNPRTEERMIVKFWLWEDGVPLVIPDVEGICWAELTRLGLEVTKLDEADVVLEVEDEKDAVVVDDDPAIVESSTEGICELVCDIKVLKGKAKTEIEVVDPMAVVAARGKLIPFRSDDGSSRPSENGSSVGAGGIPKARSGRLVMYVKTIDLIPLIPK